MKVYDCFIFFNEIEILDIRFNELDPYVDFFVIVESRETHSGLKKDLYFEKNKHLFEKYSDKIIYIVMDSLTNPEIKKADSREEEIDIKLKKKLPHFIRKCREYIWLLFPIFQNSYNLLNKWNRNLTNIVINKRFRKFIRVMDPKRKRKPPSKMRENLQRNELVKALERANDDDIVMISDLDEIPRGILIDQLKKTKKPVVFEHICYAYYLNWMVKRKWNGTVLIKKKWLKHKTPVYFRKVRGNFEKVINGGWHFTYMGGKERLYKKIESFWHYNEKKYTKSKRKRNYLKEISKNTIKVKIDKSYPDCIHKMIEKYPYLLNEEDI
ncbi:MAG: hypothetical protein ACFFDH_06240 [Promethearchaeota archaeon]